MTFEPESLDQQQRLRLFAEADMDFGLFFMDVDGIVTEWGGGAEKVTGFSASDMLDRPGEAIFVPEDLAAGVPERERATARRDGQAVDERWHQKKDGARFFAVGRLVALRDRSGDLHGYAKILRDATLTKRAELALQDALLSFRGLADNMSQFAWMADPAGNIFWYNKRWFAYTGTTLETMKGWGWKAVYHPEHIDRVVKSYTRAIRTGLPWEDTFPLRRADGVYRWFLSRAVPVRDENGAITRWFGTNTDIDESMRAQQSLSESEERFRLFFESAAAGHTIVDVQSDRFVRTNRLFSQITGYSPAELSSLSPSDLIHPADREIDRARLQRLHEGSSEEVSVEVRYTRKDKLVVWVHCTSTVRRGPDGKPTLQMNLVRDVTARKIAERELLESRAQLRLTVEAAELGTFFHDGITGQHIWNARLKQLLGLPLDTRESADLLFSAVHPEDRAAVERTLSTIMSEANPEREFKLDFRVVWPNGTIHHLLATGRTVFETLVDGTRAGRLVGAVRDVTKTKRFAMELQNQVAERTLALQEKTAQLEGFCYTVAHDLRSPLRAVSGYADALEEEFGPSLDPLAVEYLKRIKTAGIRMDELITDLLAYSRVSQVDLALEDVPLESSVTRAMQQLRAEIQAKEAEIEVENPLPLVRAERAILDQVIVNLLSNALKFVAPGTRPKIRLTATEKSGQVRFSIQDNGIGIQETYRDRIFKVFERLREARDYPGTGVGLAIVAKAIERLGGTVGLASEPGKGSTFYFELQKAQG